MSTEGGRHCAARSPAGCTLCLPLPHGHRGSRGCWRGRGGRAAAPLPPTRSRSPAACSAGPRRGSPPEMGPGERGGGRGGPAERLRSCAPGGLRSRARSGRPARDGCREPAQRAPSAERQQQGFVGRLRYQSRSFLEKQPILKPGGKDF